MVRWMRGLAWVGLAWVGLGRAAPTGPMRVGAEALRARSGHRGGPGDQGTRGPGGGERVGKLKHEHEEGCRRNVGVEGDVGFLILILGAVRDARTLHTVHAAARTLARRSFFSLFFYFCA